MSRYIVTPILSPRNIPYYVVTDNIHRQRRGRLRLRDVGTAPGRCAQRQSEHGAGSRQSGLSFWIRQITPRVSTIGKGEQNEQ